MPADPVPTPHIAASAGQIADAVLLPGDPLRARTIAERFLSDVVCYSEVRNMLGFTGTYKGRRVSVQGTGMGMPSMSIYATELLRFYGVRTAIRVGTAGGLIPEVRLRELVIALSAHTDSGITARRFPGYQYAPTADFTLAVTAARLATERGLPAHVGPVLSSDVFYEDNALYAPLQRHGTLAVEMECAALYTIAAEHGAAALSLLAVTDHLVTGEHTSTDERRTGFLAVAELALDTLLAVADPPGGSS
jgi:purine-nucleoside phosphorylase